MLAGGPVGWFEPTYKSLELMWEELVKTCYPITAKKNEQSRRLRLTTGGALEMWSLEDPDSGRGRQYQRIILNEAAKVKKLEYAWNILFGQPWRT